MIEIDNLVDRHEAIYSLVGGNIKTSGENCGKIFYLDGQTPVTESEIDAEVIRLQASYDAQAYSRKREAEYPSIQECVHAILDDDLTALQEKRQAVKTKYPKS
jgi:hypothetical protein